MLRWAKRLVTLVGISGTLWAAASGVWLDVPFIQQEKNGCGAASIAMVMQYWQRQQGQAPTADPAEIQRTLYSSKGHGIYASDLETYFRQHGYRVFAFRGEWSDLQDHLSKGRPLIVALKPGRGALHYVVVAGVDPHQGVVEANDPAERKLLKTDRSTFEKEWKAAGNWTLLAVPQSPSS
jgi:ABC-type bacteriocin/lantibiotic exporter with double-glycine peptidase domain